MTVGLRWRRWRVDGLGGLPLKSAVHPGQREPADRRGSRCHPPSTDVGATVAPTSIPSPTPTGTPPSVSYAYPLEASSNGLERFASYLGVNGVYTCGQTFNESEKSYGYEPAVPACLKETGYELEDWSSGDTASVRPYQWWAALSGCTSGFAHGHRDAESGGMKRLVTSGNGASDDANLGWIEGPGIACDVESTDECDILVVGAGFAGLLLWSKLSQAGSNCPIRKALLIHRDGGRGEWKYTPTADATSIPRATPLGYSLCLCRG